MCSYFTRISWLILLLALSTAVLGRGLTTPVEVIRSLYQSYLHSLGSHSKLAEPVMPYSVEFQRAIDENERVCREFATGVCGFGADGDVLLDSQEYESGLSLKNSGARIFEERQGVVTVKLNVYPSIPTKDGFYEKRVSFKMIFESDAWVIDDLWYADKVSLKARMHQENEFYRDNPDPGSVHMKKKSE